jgi:hypothetical protein
MNSYASAGPISGWSASALTSRRRSRPLSGFLLLRAVGTASADGDLPSIKTMAIVRATVRREP